MGLFRKSSQPAVVEQPKTEEKPQRNSYLNFYRKLHKKVAGTPT